MDNDGASRWDIALNVARLLVLRAALPQMLNQETLPAVMERLCRPRLPLPLDTVETAIQSGELLLSAIPWVPSTCLYRTVARHVLLRRAGLDSRFSVGVRRGRTDIEAHAWLTLEGRPYLENEPPAYHTTYVHPADHETRRGGDRTT